MRSNQYNCWIIWFSFVIAIILQAIPWPLKLSCFRPSWISLLLIYWTISLPNKINTITSFIIGVLTDEIFGYILGVHALSFSIIYYLIRIQYNLISNLIIYCQSIIIMVLSLINQITVFSVYFFIEDISFSWELFCTILVDGILWPWLFFFMHKIQRRLL